MAKFRSKVNYRQIYEGDKQGFNLGLDGAIFLKEEAIPRTFQAPSVGTAGKSVSGTSPETDISAEAGNKLKVAVGGKDPVVVTLVNTALTTGAAIAAELETKINSALAAAGLDERVWAEFDGAFTIHNQGTGLTSTVVVTDADADNIADKLKLGVANGGNETPGTDDTDFLLYTTGGPKFEQPIESNTHRSGRFHAGIVKKKKVATFDIDTFINMEGDAGASLDRSVQLLLESALGGKTVNEGVSIDFFQDLPIRYMTMCRISTIFGEYYTGAYVRDMTLTFPGDGPATIKYSGKAADRAIAGIAHLTTAASGTDTVTVQTGEQKRYSKGGRVMLVDTDGRTILAGMDGTLSVVAVDDALHTVKLSAAVTTTAGYLVPWHPGAVQQTGRDNIFTDLAGSFKLHAGGQAIDVTNIELSFTNDHNDLDNRFGKSTNAGYIPGNRLTPQLSVTFDLSNETFGDVVRTADFGGYSPEIVLGDEASSRCLKITAPRWIPAVPAIEVPENGPTPVTLTGNLFQSAPGARDPFKLSFR